VSDFSVGSSSNGVASTNENRKITLPVESTASPEPGCSTPSTVKDRIPRAVGKSKAGEGMRRGLELYKERYPNVEAILVGTRKGDPHGGAYFPPIFPPIRAPSSP
jgi:hypothetical protein